eukprot:3731958-Rhodomonas_salina.1
MVLRVRGTDPGYGGTSVLLMPAPLSGARPSISISGVLTGAALACRGGSALLCDVRCADVRDRANVWGAVMFTTTAIYLVASRKLPEVFSLPLPRFLSRALSPLLSCPRPALPLSLARHIAIAPSSPVPPHEQGRTVHDGRACARAGLALTCGLESAPGRRVHDDWTAVHGLAGRLPLHDVRLHPLLRHQPRRLRAGAWACVWVSGRCRVPTVFNGLVSERGAVCGVRN